MEFISVDPVALGTDILVEKIGEDNLLETEILPEKIIYPDYIPKSVIRDRELQLLARKPRDQLRNDISTLSAEF